jgi:hypothetical protein
MITRRAIALPLLVLFAAMSACEREPKAIALPPLGADSAGWRAARIANNAVELRYPTALIPGVVDRTTESCSAPGVAALMSDTTLDNRLIALNTAQPIDSVAAPLGFLKQGATWMLDPRGPQGWSGGLEADSVRDGEWTSLHGEVNTKVITEDQKLAPGEDHLTPQSWQQSRFVAMRPLTGTCALALVWWGDVRRAVDDSTQIATRRAVLQDVLHSVHVRR